MRAAACGWRSWKHWMRIAFTECRRRKRQEAACDREHGQRPCQSGDGACKESKSKTGTGRHFWWKVRRCSGNCRWRNAAKSMCRKAFCASRAKEREKLLAGCRYETVTDEVMRHMSDTQTPQGILAVAEQIFLSALRCAEKIAWTERHRSL